MDEQKKKNIFMRIVDMLKEDAVRFGLLLLFLLVFSWPYLSFLNQASPEAVFGYFFVAWAVLVGVLWLSNMGKEDDTIKK